MPFIELKKYPSGEMVLVNTRTIEEAIAIHRFEDGAASVLPKDITRIFRVGLDHAEHFDIKYQDLRKRLGPLL